MMVTQCSSPNITSKLLKIARKYKKSLESSEASQIKLPKNHKKQKKQIISLMDRFLAPRYKTTINREVIAIGIMNGEIYLLNKCFELIRRVKGHNQSINNMSYLDAHRSNILATSAVNKILKIWDLDRRTLLCSKNLGFWVTKLFSIFDMGNAQREDIRIGVLGSKCICILGVDGSLYRKINSSTGLFDALYISSISQLISLSKEKIILWGSRSILESKRERTKTTLTEDIGSSSEEKVEILISHKYTKLSQCSGTQDTELLLYSTHNLSKLLIKQSSINSERNAQQNATLGYKYDGKIYPIINNNTPPIKSIISLDHSFILGTKYGSLLHIRKEEHELVEKNYKNNQYQMKRINLSLREIEGIISFGSLFLCLSQEGILFVIDINTYKRRIIFKTPGKRAFCLTRLYA